MVGQQVLAAIRDHACRPLESFPRYRKIKSAGIEHAEECYDGSGMECDVTPAEALSAAEFDTWGAIEEAAKAIEGDVTLEALAHSCVCSACEAGTMRRSLKVAVKLGELAFTREYALGD